MVMTINDAKIAIGMVNRGDKHHDVAAWFGENQARIAEALEGKFGTMEAAPADQLPPKGSPGVKGRRLRGGVTKAIGLLSDGKANEALETLETALQNYNKNE
jgi:hypothetical protein